MSDISRRSFGGYIGMLIGMPMAAYADRDVFKRTVGFEKHEALFESYLNKVWDYLNHTPMTDEQSEIDAQIMGDIEERINIQEWAVDDFRRSLGAFFGYMLAKGMPIHWDSNPMLKKAIEYKLEDRHDES